MRVHFRHVHYNEALILYLHLNKEKRMNIPSDELIKHFNTGDIVRAKSKPQRLRVIECKVGMAHIFIESVRSIHYKCEWLHPNGQLYSEWYNGDNLEIA